MVLVPLFFFFFLSPQLAKIKNLLLQNCFSIPLMAMGGGGEKAIGGGEAENIYVPLHTTARVITLSRQRTVMTLSWQRMCMCWNNYTV